MLRISIVQQSTGILVLSSSRTLSTRLASNKQEHLTTEVSIQPPANTSLHTGYTLMHCVAVFVLIVTVQRVELYTAKHH
jgi:hypothetical protein